MVDRCMNKFTRSSQYGKKVEQQLVLWVLILFTVFYGMCFSLVEADSFFSAVENEAHSIYREHVEIVLVPQCTKELIEQKLTKHVEVRKPSLKRTTIVKSLIMLTVCNLAILPTFFRKKWGSLGYHGNRHIKKDMYIILFIHNLDGLKA
ncbi:MAG: hypothetical protein GX567_07020 [Clostridia bacterium]|nr:hypothetical protein [Clostridia bacterium]